MDTTKIRTVIFVVVIFFCVIVAPVSADWDEGDSCKMHFPQLPDPDGWDVANYNWINGEPLLLADDWLCTETGDVTDIHIWGSWLNNSKGEIVSFNVSIWSNDNGTNFSHPGELLWQHTFSGSEIEERYWCNGSQGWWEFRSYATDRSNGVYSNDHNDTWQYNLHIDPVMAFKQQEGTIYWLALAPEVNSPAYSFGWKTSGNAWQDIFVVEDLNEYGGSEREGIWLSWSIYLEGEFHPAESLAFVIGTPLPPEPEVPLLTPIGFIALVSLLSAIAAVAIVRKRH